MDAFETINAQILSLKNYVFKLSEWQKLFVSNSLIRALRAYPPRSTGLDNQAALAVYTAIQAQTKGLFNWLGCLFLSGLKTFLSAPFSYRILGIAHLDEEQFDNAIDDEFETEISEIPLSPLMHEINTNTSRQPAQISPAVISHPLGQQKRTPSLIVPGANTLARSRSSLSLSNTAGLPLPSLNVAFNHDEPNQEVEQVLDSASVRISPVLNSPDCKNIDDLLHGLSGDKSPYDTQNFINYIIVNNMLRACTTLDPMKIAQFAAWFNLNKSELSEPAQKALGHFILDSMELCIPTGTRYIKSSDLLRVKVWKATRSESIDTAAEATYRATQKYRKEDNIQGVARSLLTFMSANRDAAFTKKLLENNLTEELLDSVSALPDTKERKTICGCFG